jgi:hypothetical protein
MSLWQKEGIMAHVRTPRQESAKFALEMGLRGHGLAIYVKEALPSTKRSQGALRERNNII